METTIRLPLLTQWAGCFEKTQKIINVEDDAEKLNICELLTKNGTATMRNNMRVPYRSKQRDHMIQQQFHFWVYN